MRVSVPATSANLGPGFDSLGLAVDLHDVLEAEVIDAGLAIEVEGEGADGVPLDASHLVVRSMQLAFDAMQVEPPGLRLKCTNRIPHARGLGSSSAAIVGGLVLARALVAGGRLLLDDDALLQLAATEEGHPDNVAPALSGGFVISGEGERAWFAVSAPVDPRVSVAVFVPAAGLETKVARGLLPATVSHADAARNAGRAALLVAALASRPELLLTATEDRLHQDHREPGMPESLALMRALRADGHPAIISGAGPTVLTFTDGTDLTSYCPQGWRVLHLAVATTGAQVLP